MNFRGSLAALFVISSLVVLAGCSSPPPAPAATAQAAPARAARGPQSDPARASVPAPAQPVADAVERPLEQAAPTAPEPRLADRISSQLESPFLVMEVSSSTLLVKKKGTAPAPSLYEESIALSRLRGQLKSKADLPPDTARKTSLRNGTAEIPLPSTIAPAAAAGIVSSALALDGIQKVRLVLPR